MKRLPLLVCAALLAATPVASQAAVQADGLHIGLGVGLLMGFQDRDRRHGRDEPAPQAERRGGDERRGGGDPRYAPQPRYAPPPAPMAPAPRQVPGPPVYRGYGGAYDRRSVVVGGGYRDERINRAIAIARSHGYRFLDAGPVSGSVFWVRVATGRGRVDLLIDADTGQIVGQR